MDTPGDDESGYYYHPSPTELHPPISPASPAESLFLSGLQTANISASALAHEIRRNYRGGATPSIANTDDFATAVESADDIEDPDSYSFFGRDVLLQHTREPIVEDSLEEEEDEYYNPKMTTITTATNADVSHVDPASHVYEGAKGVWAWGKSVPVFSPFFGITEAVAGKVVGVAGTSLPDIDGKIKPHLAGLDEKFLNPAIGVTVAAILGALSKSEDVIKPLVLAFLKPLGLIKEKSETPEVTETEAAK